MSSGRRSPGGRSFHSRGPAAEKLLSPSLLCVRGTSSFRVSLELDRNGRRPTSDRRRQSSARYASTRWRSVAVMNPLHAGDAYVSRDTTTARKTASRPISVMPWWRSTRSAYSDCALSLIIRRLCSDADRWFVMVMPRIFSAFSLDMSGSGCGSVSAILRLEF